MKLAPNIVSGRVVYTSILSESILSLGLLSILNFILRPSDLPIQFFCITFTWLDQLSNLSRLSIKSSAYSVILKNH